jgi:ubiquinol-cytochrome c reductase iron-sulfur subunit
MTQSVDLPGQRPVRRDFIRIAALAFSAGGLAVAAWPLIDQMNPSADTPQPMTWDLRKVPLGQQVAVFWRRWPLFIRHRTPTEIAAAARDDRTPMADLQADADRVKAGHAEWLIVVGVCTFEGCTPNFGEGAFGGWLCPCCGSAFDTSGRVRKGPAQGGSRNAAPGAGTPKNLVVPDYEFPDEHTVRLIPS